MSTILQVIISILGMTGIMYCLYFMKNKRYSFTARVLTGLALGIIYGAVLQSIYGVDSVVIKQANGWFDIISTGYVRLLKMIVIPLVFVSITSSVINQNSNNLGKMAGLIIGVLIATTAISALVGVGSANYFDLNAKGMEIGESESQRSEYLESKLEDYKSKPIQKQIVEIIPTNPFYSMTGQGSSSTLSVVVFAAFIAIAVLGLKRKKPESAEFFISMINSLHDVVMRLVTLILRLTPYGVTALMTKFISTSNYSEILRLLNFVLASYIAIIIMFIIHLIIITFIGLNPITYIKKVIHVLIFAFTSRTSAGTLPLNVEAQKDKLGVDEGYANLSASLGTSIGQNGCAGIYPAMLAVMIAPVVGINPMDPVFLIKLVIVTSLSSFGIAGVGGGATFAALTVLSAMGLPVGLVGLLIAIEPLIDMARTALNVSGSMVAGLVSSKIMNKIDMDLYNS
ncbi:L-cystine transporter [Tepidibacter aestuarii]|uniref:L-cystine transporter n=1 Tax=Tepidibacter aestuarii TaxID=2925782 RepID=UPI0020BFAC19|nr:cation:dicarboxylase symporter family transporter [Tepidibacter aestuarii]CAH2212503.1 (sodium)-cystine symporter [Tepidibacter aestuarii]